MPRDSNPSNRVACDRCHSQKLRCQRQDSQGSCVRCSRVNAACVFSPRQRRTVQPRNAPSAPTTASTPFKANVQNVDDDSDFHLEGLDPDVDIDVDPYDIDASFLRDDLGAACGVSPTPIDSFDLSDEWLSRFQAGNQLGLDLEVSGGGINNFPPHSTVCMSDENTITNTDIANEETGSSSTVDPVSYVRQLADLNVRLYEHAEKLPPVSAAVSDQAPSLTGRIVAIDNIFSMTQLLVNILKRLYSHIGPPPSFVPDQATLLLIMSCSDRVFDIYETIFGHMRGCIKHKATPITSEGETLLLPQLRIGSFVPPTPAAIAVQMLLIVMMASELFDQLQEVLGVWQRKETAVRSSHGHFEFLQLTTGSKSRFPGFTEDAKAEMSRRASRLANEIAGTRQLLLTMPGMVGTGSLQDKF